MVVYVLSNRGLGVLRFMWILADKSATSCFGVAWAIKLHSAPDKQLISVCQGIHHIRAG